MKKNLDLKKDYENIYINTKENFFSRFVNNKDISETNEIVLNSIEFRDKTVLDFGCGTGETAFNIAKLKAKNVIGIDYSRNAIDLAKEKYNLTNLNYYVDDNIDEYGNFDIIVSCGTLEHVDSPKKTLRSFIKKINPGGSIVLTCPYFINIKGFVWMTLALALDIRMSLTDKYFISPFDFVEWLDGTGFELKQVTPFDYERANGKIMIDDMRKRLNNALKEKNFQTSGVKVLLEWLEKVIEYENIYSHNFGGLNCLYIISKK